MEASDKKCQEKNWQIREFEILKIDGFNLANCYQRTESKGGGVIIFVRDTLKFTKHESPIVNGILESTSILIDNLIVTSIYRPPSGNKSQFIEQLIDWVETLGNKKLYIAGDFNLNYKNQDINYYKIVEESTALKASISDTTRVISNTCIDNILTNCEGQHSVSSICIADHQGLLSNLKISISKKM